MNPIRNLAIALALTPVLAGCGGGAAGSSAPSADPAPGATAGSSAEASSAPTGLATETPATGGGGTGGVCDLVTAEELAGVLGGSVTTQVIAGPPDTCEIKVDGAPVAAMVYTTSEAAMIFDVWASSLDTDPVAGIGDKAMFATVNQLLIVLKGDRLISITVLNDPSAEVRLERMKAIAAFAVGRM